jgi:hypothetical protein
MNPLLWPHRRAAGTAGRIVPLSHASPKGSEVPGNNKIKWGGIAKPDLGISMT